MASSDFRPLTDLELQSLSDDELIAYLRAARDGADLGAARLALQILVFGHMPDVRRRVRIKVPAHQVEDVAHDALVEAIAAAFDGTSVGEFRSWLNTIVSRKIADFYRAAERRPKEELLPSEHAGDDEVWGGEPLDPAGEGAVEVEVVVEGLLADLGSEHAQVVELYVFEDLTAAETCARTGMTEDNVYKIAERFRTELRGRLEGDGDTGSQR